MSSWDVFVADRLEVLRGLATAEVRAALARGELREDDLIRPAGSNLPWTRLSDEPGLADVSGDLAAAPHRPVVENPPGPPRKPNAEGVGTGSDVETLSVDQMAGAFPPVRPADEPPGDERGEARPTLAFEPEPDDEDDRLSRFAFDHEEEEGPESDPGPMTEGFALDDEDDEDEAGPIPTPPPAAPTSPRPAPGRGLDDSEELVALTMPSLADLRAAEGSPFEPESLSAIIDEEDRPPAQQDLGRLDLDLKPQESRVVLPVDDEERADALGEAAAEADDDEYDPAEEDEEAAEFTLARGAAEKVEELDLAAMVDVAFQLVLFFLVTATTILYKTLEVPKPNPDENPAEAAQQAPNPSRSLEDLQADYILVGIDPQGNFTVDREPVRADFATLAERLRKSRQDTGRTAMLLTADAQALHRHAVLAYDVANEIGLRIAIAKPKPPAAGPAPPPARAP